MNCSYCKHDFGEGPVDKCRDILGPDCPATTAATPTMRVKNPHLPQVGDIVSPIHMVLHRGRGALLNGGDGWTVVSVGPLEIAAVNDEGRRVVGSPEAFVVLKSRRDAMREIDEDEDESPSVESSKTAVDFSAAFAAAMAHAKGIARRNAIAALTMASGGGSALSVGGVGQRDGRDKVPAEYPLPDMPDNSNQDISNLASAPAALFGTLMKQEFNAKAGATVNVYRKEMPTGYSLEITETVEHGIRTSFEAKVFS
jgi:hypothetical protein